jgi:dCMP deaminase
MNRISRHQMYMDMARAASRRSTCFRLNVGCILVRDTNVVGIGYNGAPPGVDHCTGNGCQHFTPIGCRVRHAEWNALKRSTQAWDTMYVTHSPCMNCATLIVTEKVQRAEDPLPMSLAVYFETEYRDRAPLEWLLRHRVPLYRLTPSGYVVDIRTNQMMLDV